MIKPPTKNEALLSDVSTFLGSRLTDAVNNPDKVMRMEGTNDLEAELREHFTTAPEGQEPKYTPAQIDREREFIERILRTEVVTAAYGTTTSLQVSNEYDNQLLKAIELLPQARQLALDAARAKASASKETSVNER